MKTFGLDEDEWRYLQDVFASTQALEKVVLYGSRAKGNYKPFSDIDITLMGQNLSESDLTDVMSKLDESSLPYFCDVSLFKNLTSKPLLDHIMRRGKTIYQRQVS
ncbi:MAG: nucleotidyltransferase domain-containing protein [Prevotella sp.]|nr:nucleotidyltransferase domain-containing protein [Prevotella sp.]